MWKSFRQFKHQKVMAQGFSNWDPSPVEDIGSSFWDTCPLEEVDSPMEDVGGNIPVKVPKKIRGSTVCPGCNTTYKNNAVPPFCSAASCDYPIGRNC